MDDLRKITAALVAGVLTKMDFNVVPGDSTPELSKVAPTLVADCVGLAQEIIKQTPKHLKKPAKGV